MKIVVIGGTGLIGTKLVAQLRAQGHHAVAASPGTGVDSITGKGLAAAMEGAHVVVDVSNSPSFEDKAVMAFFETSTRNLIAAASSAGIAHYVALSVVGTERMPDIGYFRAKLAQEALIKASGIAYSLVHATQFFEFLAGIVQGGAEGAQVRLPSAQVQLIASTDVASALTEVALGAPLNGTLEIAGPDKTGMAAIAQRYLLALGDARQVVPDAQARYFGSVLDDTSLVPQGAARLGTIDFDTWFAQSKA